MLSEIFGQGESSRLFQQLVKDKKLFNNLSAYHMGSTDRGMLVVSGKLNQGIALETAEAALDEAIAELVKNGVTADELQKAKNRQEAIFEFTNVEVLNRAINLAMSSLWGDPDLVNTDPEKMGAVTLEQINLVAANILQPHKANTLIYKAKKD
jgi:predicted Zn-dependent peptidase